MRGETETMVKSFLAEDEIAMREEREVAHAVDESLMGYSYLSVQ